MVNRVGDALLDHIGRMGGERVGDRISARVERDRHSHQAGPLCRPLVDRLT